MATKNSKKKTKKLIIDQYDPQIYPRLLWCCKNAKLSDLQKRFVLRDKKEIDESWHPQEGVYTLYVEEISTKKYGCLVNFPDYVFKDKDNFINVITHEAEHVKNSIFYDIHLDGGIEADEADAYLVGWIAQCIYNTMIKK